MIAKKIINKLPDTLQQRIKELFNREGTHKSSQRNALLAFIIRVASAAIAFFSQVLLARWIGAHEYGIYTYIWVWVNVIGTLCTAGFATSVVRFIPEYLEKGKFGRVRGFLRTGHFFSVSMGLTATVCGFYLLYHFEGALADYYRIPAAIALLALPAYAMTDYQDGVGRSMSWIDLALVPPYIIRPLLLLIFIATAVTIGWSKNAETAVYAAITASWLTAVIQYALQKRRFRQRVPAAKRQYNIGFWLKVSLPVIAIESLTLMLTNMDILLLDLFVSPDQIAIYFAAARTIALISFVHFSVTAAVTPKFTTFYTNGDLKGLRDFLKATRKWTFIPSLIGGIAILVIGKPVLWLFGSEFISAYPVLFVLVIGLLVRALAGPLQGLMIAMGQQNMAAVVMAIVVISNISLNLLFIPRFGLVGAAAATTISFTFESLLLFIWTRRIINRSAIKKTKGSRVE